MFDEDALVAVFPKFLELMKYECRSGVASELINPSIRMADTFPVVCRRICHFLILFKFDPGWLLPNLCWINLPKDTDSIPRLVEPTKRFSSKELIERAEQELPSWWEELPEKSTADQFALQSSSRDHIGIESSRWLLVELYRGLGTALAHVLSKHKEEFLGLIATVSRSHQMTRKSIKSFPSPDDLKWEEVTITFVSNEAITIKARSARKTYMFSEIGFKDGRSTALSIPNTSWKKLRGLAELDGDLSFEDRASRWDPGKRRSQTPDGTGHLAGKVCVPHKLSSMTKSDIYLLRKKLKSIMGLEEDPFEPYNRREKDESGKYKTVKSYTTRFRLTVSETLRGQI